MRLNGFAVYTCSMRACDVSINAFLKHEAESQVNGNVNQVSRYQADVVVSLFSLCPSVVARAFTVTTNEQ